MDVLKGLDPNLHEANAFLGDPVDFSVIKRERDCISPPYQGHTDLPVEEQIAGILN